MSKIFFSIISLMALLFGAIAVAGIDVTVCHATASSTNPYNEITVSVNSVDDANGLNGHGNHIDDAWMSYIFDGVTYPGQNENLFGTVINSDCSLFVQPTETFTPPPLPTDTPTLPPTNTPLPPTPTNTLSPTDPPTATLQPTTTIIATINPTATSTPVPTNTPFPPQPAIADSNVDYPGEYLGTMIIGINEFRLYQGVNAADGSLMLPSYHKGAALYQGTVWVHRSWATGWINIKVNDTVIIENQSYKVVSADIIDYGVYPASSEDIKYIATCYSDNGNWAGVMVYTLSK